MSRHFADKNWLYGYIAVSCLCYLYFATDSLVFTVNRRFATHHWAETLTGKDPMGDKSSNQHGQALNYICN